ncbi:hypothetical protein BDV97DRAFT_93013 [Delphinella strobiligena]|nr:hypothetical protein BDV97DRAFT_93013 [Delphinella strobiligena]
MVKGHIVILEMLAIYSTGYARCGFLVLGAIHLVDSLKAMLETLFALYADQRRWFHSTFSSHEHACYGIAILLPLGRSQRRLRI